MKKTIILLASAIVFFTSCKNNTAENSNNSTSTTDKTADSTIIRNHIETKTTGGVQVSQVFMMRNDGSLLPNDNKIKVGEVVELRLLAHGWKGDAKNNISLGASEKIKTSDGSEALNITDLFEKQAAIPGQKAQLLRIQATVTKQNKEYDYYSVTFKVWNKTTPQSIEGTYKVFVQ